MALLPVARRPEAPALTSTLDSELVLLAASKLKSPLAVTLASPAAAMSVPSKLALAPDLIFRLPPDVMEPAVAVLLSLDDLVTPTANPPVLSLMALLPPLPAPLSLAPLAAAFTATP